MAKEIKDKDLLTEQEFKVKEQNIRAQEESWAREKALLERQYKIQEERRNLKPKTKVSTTKWIVLFLFLNCTLVEIFTAWATYKSLYVSEIMGTYADFSPLVALVGAVVGEVMGFAVYASKAKAENCKDGIVYLQTEQELARQYEQAAMEDEEPVISEDNDDEEAMG